MTTRVQAKRKNGKVVTPFDVYIGRACYRGGWSLPKSKWANPYVIGKDGNRDEVIGKYLSYILKKPELLKDLHELEGKRIACFCKLDEDCHGDILIGLIEGDIKYEI
jgi:hypothetical protein